MTAGPDRRWPFSFVDSVDEPVLAPADRHHLERVRRLRPSDRLTVGDGAGRFRAVRFGPELTVDGPILTAPVPSPGITIAFALTKGDNPELVVQKLVEIGVDRIVPFIADRTIVRWEPDKSARNVTRLQAIAREAAAQAHRPHLAEVTGIHQFAEVACIPDAALAHPEGPALEAGTTTLLVGPEGGWSASEEAAVTRRAGLGPHILRAETAALVAGALAVWTNRGHATERG